MTSSSGVPAGGGMGELFTHWPEQLPRRGVLVTTFGEQIPFNSFMLRGELLVVQRRAPDTSGARQVILALSQISALKIVDVVKAGAFEAAGFKGKLEL